MANATVYAPVWVVNAIAHAHYKMVKAAVHGECQYACRMPVRMLMPGTSDWPITLRMNNFTAIAIVRTRFAKSTVHAHARLCTAVN